MKTKYLTGFIGVVIVYLLGSFYFVSFNLNDWKPVGRFLTIMAMPIAYLYIITFPVWEDN